jgi:hypothetical protein
LRQLRRWRPRFSSSAGREKGEKEEEEEEEEEEQEEQEEEDSLWGVR